MVTGRFEHSSAEVLSLYVEGERNANRHNGQPPVLEPGPSGLCFRRIAQELQNVCSLEDGRTAAGHRESSNFPALSPSTTSKSTDEHVYHVGLHGVLVHNMCAPGEGMKAISTGETFLRAKGKLSQGLDAHYEDLVGGVTRTPDELGRSFLMQVRRLKSMS